MKQEISVNNEYTCSKLPSHKQKEGFCPTKFYCFIVVLF